MYSQMGTISGKYKGRKIACLLDGCHGWMEGWMDGWLDGWMDE